MKKILVIIVLSYIFLIIFACSDDNSSSSDIGTDIITVDNTPPQFGGITVLSISFPEYIKVSWLPARDNVTSESKIIYLICMSEKEGECSTNFETNYTVTGLSSYQVTGLSDGKKYSFLVRAKDEAGNIDTNTVEKSVIFEKEKDKNPPTFMGLLYATPQTENSVKLLWDSATDNNTTEDKIIYSICMSEQKNECVSNFKESFKADAGSTSYLVEGLTTGKTYYFVVHAMDEDGNVEMNQEERSARPSADTRFAKTYGDATYRGASSFVRFSDGFLICGSGRVGDMLDSDIFITDLDTSGNVKWVKAYGGLKQDSCNSIVSSNEGYFYVAATSQSFSQLGDKDLLFLKFSDKGDPIFTKRIHSDKNDLNSQLAILQDGNIVFTGYTEMDNLKYDTFILLFDKDGNVINKKYIHSEADDYVTRVKVFGEKIYIAGYTNPESETNFDGFLIVLDKDLNILNQKLVGGSDYENFTALNITDGGDIILGGQTKSFGDVDGDIFVVNLKSDLTGKNFAKVYGIDEKKDTAGDITIFNDSIIVVGDMVPPIGGDDDGIFLRMDQTGNLLVNKYYRGIRDDWFIRSDADNESIYILGGTASMHNETPEIWFLRLNDDGTTGGECSVSFINELTVTVQDIEPVITDGRFELNDAKINIEDVTLDYVETGAYTDYQCVVE